MRILHRVPSIEVKRAFVMAQKMRFSRRSGRKYLPKISKAEFLIKMKRAKKSANTLTEKQLDKVIADDYQKRADAYNNADWFKAVVSINEAGVWRRAGGLPSQWTCCSLSQTALKVKRGLERNSRRIRARSKRAIPRIMEFANIIGKEKYLSPIAFVGGTGTRVRKWCKKATKVDIDDGCMRSIALAISGKKTLSVYLGKPKKG